MKMFHNLVFLIRHFKSIRQLVELLTNFGYVSTMNGIIRTWRCLNARCGGVFNSWEPNPSCPSCQCVRVDWQPAGGHVGGSAKGADSELRALADIFKMGDLNSAEEGRAAKKVSLPPAPARNGAPAHTFRGGFSAVVNPEMGAQCVPTSNKVDFKVGAKLGERLAHSRTIPGIRSNTAVEAAYKG
jgi:hypothetical protein